MEANGLEEDPLRVAPELDDFHLSVGSLAIDSADSSVRGELPTDIENQVRVDVPEVPNLGSGSRTYDDRGAYEFNSDSADVAVGSSD